MLAQGGGMEIFMIATIFISAVILAVVVLNIRKIIKDKKNGGCGCSCGSSGQSCSMAEYCHKKTK